MLISCLEDYSSRKRSSRRCGFSETSSRRTQGYRKFTSHAKAVALPQSVGCLNTATGAFQTPLEVLQREVYVTLLMVQDVTLLVAVAILLVGATRGRLGYDIPERDLEDMQFPVETDDR